MRITKEMLRQQEERDARLASNQVKCLNIICQKLNIFYNNAGDVFIVNDNDQTHTQIRFSGKNLKYPLPGIIFDDEKDVMFDPYNNSKLMISMIFLYMNNLAEDPKEIMSVNLSTTRFNRYGSAKIQFMDGTEINGHEYHRDSLKYLDLIFIMDNSNPFEFKQLKEIDLDGEDVIDRRTIEAYKKSKGLL